MCPAEEPGSRAISISNQPALDPVSGHTFAAGVKQLFELGTAFVSHFGFGGVSSKNTVVCKPLSHLTRLASRSLAFSPSETALVYTAEANPNDFDNIKHEHEYEYDATSHDYDKYRFLPSFGEKLGGRKRPVLFVVRWADPSFASTTTIAKSTRFAAYVVRLIPSPFPSPPS